MFKFSKKKSKLFFMPVLCNKQALPYPSANFSKNNHLERTLYQAAVGAPAVPRNAAEKFALQVARCYAPCKHACKKRGYVWE